MIQEAESAGFYEFKGTKYKRIQILTIKDMLEQKKLFNLPNILPSKNKSNQLKLYL